MPVFVRRECQVTWRSSVWLATCAGVLAIASGPAPAQSFDCSKARPPIETAICASPRLADLDQRLALAYGRATTALPAEGAQVQQLRAQRPVHTTVHTEVSFTSVQVRQGP